MDNSFAFPSSREGERRKRERVLARSLFSQDISVNFSIAVMQVEKRAVLHSISRAGLFMRTADLLPIGARISLKFRFGRDIVRCDGLVIFSESGGENELRPSGLGVRFTRMFRQDYEQIRGAIEQFYQSTQY